MGRQRADLQGEAGLEVDVEEEERDRGGEHGRRGDRRGLRQRGRLGARAAVRRRGYRHGRPLYWSPFDGPAAQTANRASARHRPSALLDRGRHLRLRRVRVPRNGRRRPTARRGRLRPVGDRGRRHGLLPESPRPHRRGGAGEVRVRLCSPRVVGTAAAAVSPGAGRQSRRRPRGRRSAHRDRAKSGRDLRRLRPDDPVPRCRILALAAVPGRGVECRAHPW